MPSLTLTLPPTANHLWSNAPGKGRVKTAAYKEWINTAGWEIKARLPGYKTIMGPYRLRIEMSAPAQDLDNCVKPISDLLQTMAIVDNDKNMVRLEVMRWNGPRGVRIQVEVCDALVDDRQAA